MDQPRPMLQRLFILCGWFVIASLACRALDPNTPRAAPTPTQPVATQTLAEAHLPATPTPAGPAPSTETATPTSGPVFIPSPSPAVTRPSTESILARLGGYPCHDSEFTCVNIRVPLDHFDRNNTGELEVTFAVLPASGERRGMFVTATGGPGSAGLYSADAYTSAFDPRIPEHLDIVFFDQRGVGSSGGVQCVEAVTEYVQAEGGTETAAEEAALAEATADFVAACVAEIGGPALLPFLGTDQAVEDLELFRQLMSAEDQGAPPEKFWLYGESYGTQYAQTYAAAHSNRLNGLVLDGVVDLALTGYEFLEQQAQAFNDVLVMTLVACSADRACREEFSSAGQEGGGNPLSAYDALAARLARGPLPFDFPLPGGHSETRSFSLSDLENIAVYQLYTETDRMMFVRALAAYHRHADLVPLARLLYISLGIDPESLDGFEDPSWSDAIYFAVECRDYDFGPLPETGTPLEMAEAYLRAGDEVDERIPRLNGVFYSDLPCIFWPDQGGIVTRPDPLSLPGLTTLVLVSSADPATPPSNGESVFRSLEDGYLITTQGGPHVTFGRGNECPDDIVTDFLVNGWVPQERETECRGYVMEDYEPLSPINAQDFADPLEAMMAADWEIFYLPEYFYWDLQTPSAAGCPFGGTFTFEPTRRGEALAFERCAFSRGWVMTGSGDYDYETGELHLNVQISGIGSGSLFYTYYLDGATHVTGTYNGVEIDLEN